MKKLTLVTIAVLGALSVPSAFAVATGSRVNPWTFVGAAGDCGFGTPAGSPIVTAAWQAHIGVPDVDKTRQGLFLQKNGFTTDCSSAGASVAGVAGITLIEVGFDIRNDSQCSGGSPRFNVVTIDSMGNPTGHFVGGFGNSTMTSDTPVN